jgi:hypothetical protein
MRGVAGTPQDDKESGQAAVESALTLPLIVFLILGTIQLFMMLQGRLMAQYGVYKAVRVGSVNQGSCLAMTHAALAAVLPTITRTDTPANLATAFRRHRENRYRQTGGQDIPIVEIVRLSPAGPDEEGNDQPGVNNRLTIRMIFWFRMKIPFANWVMSKMILTHFGIRQYTYANPLLLAQKNAKWDQQIVQLPGAVAGVSWPGGDVASRMGAWSDEKQYVFPIAVSASMRMMTPPKARFFPPEMPLECPINPNQQELP